MVIDTMVFAYAALGTTPFRHESLAVLAAASDVAVPESFLAEFVNVAWLNVRAGRIPESAADAALDDVLRYVSRRVPVSDLWHDALRLAFRHSCSPYDMLFVALAEAEGTRLVTFDAKLLQTFPSVAIAPLDYLAAP
jgi:predicted nucleic acid-binding protein